MIRYAVYFAPAPDSRFESLGAAALGRNARTGEEIPIAPVEELDPDALMTATAAPRRYGFHGTLKAPFRPAEDASEWDLLDAAGKLAATAEPFDIPAMTIRILSGFVALVPTDLCPPLQSLAEHCVRDLDHLRAPMTDDERARRKPESLSARQRDMLERWGYPYVFDEFRFHMTLSERVESDVAERIVSARQALFSDVTAAPVAVRAISVFRQNDANQAFRSIAQIPLGKST